MPTGKNHRHTCGVCEDSFPCTGSWEECTRKQGPLTCPAHTSDRPRSETEKLEDEDRWIMERNLARIYEGFAPPRTKHRKRRLT